MNKLFLLSFSIVFLFLAGCSTRGAGVYKQHKKVPVKRHVDNSTSYHNSYLKKQKHAHPTMRPYVVHGIRYYPTVVRIGDRFKGNASWYGSNFHGNLTASGEKYNMWSMTAAHKTLPMNTIVKVTNRRNGKSIVVRINDRGPFVATRIIDLSKAAASKIDMIATGTAPVIIEILGFEGKRTHSIPKKKQLANFPKSVSLDNFALQIASFSKIEGAIKTQEKYNNIDGYKSVIKDVKTDKGRLFKVWLEGFKSEQEARDYKTNSIFKHAFIVKKD